MKVNTKIAIATGTNLFATAISTMINGSIGITAPTATNASIQDLSKEQAAKINTVSLASIEKSYLQLPGMCKARNAAFDPEVISRESTHPEIAAIHDDLNSTTAAGITA